ncbi:MAG: universal stress protein [Reichenbachiella sp.]
MQHFHKILVALDGTDIDKELIYAASVISQMDDTRQIDFINVVKDVNVPKAIRAEFPNIIKDAIKERKADMGRKIEQYFDNEKIKIKIDIGSGSPTKTILKYSAKQDIDLIIMGRKNERPGGGVIINRIARRAACSLMILPKGFNKKIENILVPIDFSAPSLDSLNQTIKLANIGAPDVTIVPQNIYQVPSGYHYTGNTYKEFAKIMEENAKKEYVKFEKSFIKTSLKIKPLYTLDRHEDIIATISKTGMEKHIDGIVISAKGLTSATALFLGSKAEKLIQFDLDIPLVVLRPKGKLSGILDYLKKI